MFYNHCTFEEILEATNDRIRHHNRTVIPITSKFPGDFHDLQRITKGAWEEASLDYQKQVLKLIRDYPYSLYAGDVPVNILVHTLDTARWSLDKEKAREARYLLEDYLLPNYKEYKTNALPSNTVLRLSRTLLIHLAKRLSEECKQSVKEYMQDEGVTNSEILDEWQDCYDYILNWSRQNNGRIYLIANKSEILLKSLLTHPADYVNNLIAEYFQISLRTLKNKIKDRK